MDRPRGGPRDLLRRYNVTVDGERIGKIGRDGQLVIEVAPGSHQVEARID